MIPNIFISSTIEDLHHLRDAVRDTVEELGYNPVMSEYGDIGYLPTASAEDSCYIALKDCQIALILIGKRYGSISFNNISVTQNESQVARSKNIPLITLIDQEVLTYKRVYDANPTSHPIFPGMENPQKTFEFLQEIMDLPLNNGILPFANVTNARSHLKHQLAFLFGELLRNRFDPLKTEIKDVLSEIATLRHELTGKKDKDFNPTIFLKAMRFLLDDQNKDFRQLVEHICDSLDLGIPILLKTNTFDEFLKEAGANLEIIESKPNVQKLFADGKISMFSERTDDRLDLNEKTKSNLLLGFVYGKGLMMNSKAKRRFNYLHDAFKKAVAQ